MADQFLPPIPSAKDAVVDSGGVLTSRWRAWFQRLNERSRKPPCFAAYLGTTAEDVTGDATQYTIAPDVELFDTQGNYASGLFTAPTDGIYQFNGAIALAGVDAAHTRFLVSLQVQAGSGGSTEARLYERDAGDLQPDANNRVSIPVVYLVRMLAGNTAKMILLVSGSTKVVDVLGGTNSNVTTMLSGHLVAIGT